VLVHHRDQQPEAEADSPAVGDMPVVFYYFLVLVDCADQDSVSACVSGSVGEQRCS
jgi:hypothetical protein